jgi:hypothetical protein
MSDAIIRSLRAPLRLAPALLIVIFSILLVFARQAGLFGLPLALVLAWGFFSYSFAMLDSIVAGADELPVLSIEMLNPVAERRSVALLLLAGVLFFATDAVAYWLGPGFAALITILVVSLLPAVIATQAATGSIVQSLDPRIWIGLIDRLRGYYVLMVGGVVLLPVVGYAIAWSGLGARLPTIVRIAAFMYGWLAVLALLGSVLFERRLDVGLDVAHEPESTDSGATSQSARERDRHVDRLYAEWRGGAHENAWKTMMREVERSADPIGELHWLHARIGAWPDVRFAERIARELLSRLLARRDYGQALDVARTRLRANARFRPAQAAEALHLARLARDAGERPVARALLHDFNSYYPNDPAQSLAQRLAEDVSR